jgi:hypothetical protein
MNPTLEIIDAAEMAKRLTVTESWIRDQTRSRSKDPIPHFRFGTYVRFEWNNPKLLAWLERHRAGS